MRVTEHRLVSITTAGVTDAREKLARAQEVMQTGMNVSVPSQGAADWAAGARASAVGKLAESQGKALGRARDNLVLADSALSTMDDTLSQLREMTVQGATGTLSADDRLPLAELARTMAQTFANAANARGPDGEFLFAGTKGDQNAFDPAGAYQGDDLERNIDLGNGLPVGPARPVMINGTGLQAALPLFEKVAAALEGNDVTTLRATLADIQLAINGAATTRTTVGARMQALERADSSREAFQAQLSEAHARAVEADPIAAASNLARSAQALEAAQASAQAVLAAIRSRT